MLRLVVYCICGYIISRNCGVFDYLYFHPVSILHQLKIEDQRVYVEDQRDNYCIRSPTMKIFCMLPLLALTLPQYPGIKTVMPKYKKNYNKLSLLHFFLVLLIMFGNFRIMFEKWNNILTHFFFFKDQVFSNSLYNFVGREEGVGKIFFLFKLKILIQKVLTFRQLFF